MLVTAADDVAHHLPRIQPIRGACGASVQTYWRKRTIATGGRRHRRTHKWRLEGRHVRTHTGKYGRRHVEGDIVGDMAGDTLGKRTSMLQEVDLQGTVATGNPCQDRDTPRDYGYRWPTLRQGHPEGLQPMEEAMPEQTKQARKEVWGSKEEGAAGRSHQVLTPASCTACHLTKGPDRNLWCKRGEWRWGRGEERCLDWSWAWGRVKKGLFPKCSFNLINYNSVNWQ